MAVITGLLMTFAMGRRPASGRSPFPALSCALITGALSGLGHAFVERLTADANDVIAVARREDRLRALADRVRDAHGATTEVLVADLTAPRTCGGSRRGSPPPARAGPWSTTPDSEATGRSCSWT